VVDVFTEREFGGAQITVFTEAAGLSDTQMQTMASETSHSDTVFVVPPSNGGAARLKAFSPEGEREVGSHITVAAAFALAETGKISVKGEMSRLRFEQGQREFPVLLKQTDLGLMAQLALAVYPQIDHYVPDCKELQEILGLKAGDMEVLKARPLFV
jgi:trans-2,3-dihydro-3-hydroxyanthranilate isomerase